MHHVPDASGIISVINFFIIMSSFYNVKREMPIRIANKLRLQITSMIIIIDTIIFRLINICCAAIILFQTLVDDENN